MKSLGERTVPSPLRFIPGFRFVPDDTSVASVVEKRADVPYAPVLAEHAGPREKIFFEPSTTRVGIVTCGGLCPGVDNVVRSIVLELWHRYGVREILGFRWGYAGIAPDARPLRLDPGIVCDIHTRGGTFLGTSRGRRDIALMADGLRAHKVDVLVAIGGDGTLRGAHALHEEITRRGDRIGVVGVPKTIDDDIAFVDKTFGFDTAVEVARTAIHGAHVEAVGTDRGVSVVKLMGRDSGFIAAMATIASADVNFCLIPEIPFDLEGPEGFLAALEARLDERGHAVVVVAEGCGARLAGENAERDASGNVRYASADADVGSFLRDRIARHFAEKKLPASIKYIDPSYLIRSVPANASDAVFCDSLGRHAVHAAMAGKTDLVIGRWHRVFTHIPLPLATSHRRVVDRELWQAVLEATGQPPLVP